MRKKRGQCDCGEVAASGDQQRRQASECNKGLRSPGGSRRRVSWCGQGRRKATGRRRWTGCGLGGGGDGEDGSPQTLCHADDGKEGTAAPRSMVQARTLQIDLLLKLLDATKELCRPRRPRSIPLDDNNADGRRPAA
uniref:Uncharacterized protein n=1 Tax=Oryza meridionalis TaxID=40149 RepID=A0A0E0CXN9_9ORYZ